ncbi:NUDIX hydrolase [Calothrix sp. FACHB-1219]|uniref:NUDIX hydrolase n=1 Tax=unclassified Calothrix TaxID=2619626 RepID=UPI001683C50E|nr:MULTISPECIES: NUDIX hydrolase [unclassified Calothrix]MBD2205271.1 NUDIX hydrolase [Calothrix sp. FACHB-168]MBD2220044.1 NUDIX hydrolase [Calothrix sp. FACHB-1219]
MSSKINKVSKQSGVIPYRVQDGKIEVLLITSRDRRKWVMPKGDIPNGMSPPDSAAKEAWEEAGVIGTVSDRKIGTYKYRKRGKNYRVNMYLLPVEILCEDYPEAGHRQRQWVDISHAMNWIEITSLKRILKEFPANELIC